MLIEEFNADIDVRMDFGRGPLHLAASRYYRNDHVGVMQLLLDHGANFNARDADGCTPLHDPSWCQKGDLDPAWGSVESTRLLLKFGCDYRQRGQRG